MARTDGTRAPPAPPAPSAGLGHVRQKRGAYEKPSGPPKPAPNPAPAGQGSG
ncbi:hypothetical protein MYCTH_2302978 [Thermothelomyces thermophilus ATCC 42464]|uniref:Uncharacterized protein n=1 Tax=Thermothelomyces thermophilus (strain ATCC 42464 / BCRC 31852 / DSM 1799) TaxID=573729 RepID=G2Q900_THET4|nr:uncharacterized protein MYCTH_2302978 [Thermothelomyces thermophilus ATCC 42464]AEO57144.1 hypothetical protein MYCTH_2302978 [Thermothelomyces thermophilus ATCC 42464]